MAKKKAAAPSDRGMQAQDRALPGSRLAPAVKDLDKPSPAIDRMSYNLRLGLDLYAGTASMQDAKERWLPREGGEQQDAYIRRVNRSILFNASRRTIKSLVGRPFSKQIQVDDSLPQEIQDRLPDLDNQGSRLQIVAKDLLTFGLRDGLTGFLVDMPPKSPDERTYADQQKLNRQPYFCPILQSQLIAFETEKQGNRIVLKHLRFWDTKIVVEGFTQKEVDVIRVYEPGEYAIYEKSEVVGRGGETIWGRTDYGTYDLDYIPYVSFNPGFRSFMEGESPLLDLYWENIAHWQSQSDQRHILRFARLPILAAMGFPEMDPATAKPTTWVIGPNIVVKNPRADAKLTVVETSGVAIEAGRKDLLDCEERMAVLGTELLVKKRAQQAEAKTATQVGVDAETEYCDLALMVISLEEVLEAGFKIMADWLGIDYPEGEKAITIHKDFGITNGAAEELKVLLDARVKGELSKAQFLKEWQRRGALDAAMNIEEEMAAIEAEGPSMQQIADQAKAKAAAKGSAAAR